MRNKKVRRTLSTACAFLLIATQLVGCAGTAEKAEKGKHVIEEMEAEESKAIALDVIGGKDVMPMAGYFGPYVATDGQDGQVLPDYITDEIWEAIADCGINLMIYSPTNYRQYKNQVLKNLELGAKYNVGVVVNDGSILAQRNEETVSKEKIMELMSEYMNYPSFAGVYLIDEPHTDYFHPESTINDLNDYGELGRVLNQELGVFCYQQAYPSTGGKNEHNRYEQYIRDYCEVLQPTYLLYDRYPFDKVNVGKINDHFFDLAIIRKVAEEKNIPFWAYMGCGSQWNEGTASGTVNIKEYFPLEGEFDWHINTCLAFGMQGMVFFPLIQPYHFSLSSDGFDFGINGVLGTMGNKNRWYYYIQEISKHIGVIDEVLMNSVNKGVIVSGAQAQEDTKLAKDYDAIIEGTSWRELKDVEGDAMVGCFNYQGKTALYIVNYSTEYAQKINLKFYETEKITVIQNAETKHMKGSGITLDMLAGEGVLLVFE